MTDKARLLARDPVESDGLGSGWSVIAIDAPAQQLDTLLQCLTEVHHRSPAKSRF
jgi:hypothetical protein